jgi:hypothetical protein
MRMTRMVALLIVALDPLAGCAAGPNPVVPAATLSGAYRSAYMEGCDSGFMDAGRDGFQTDYHRDDARFQSDPVYRKGWQDGHDACFAAERRTPAGMPGG